jgi:hypothetical protein
MKRAGQKQAPEKRSVTIDFPVEVYDAIKAEGEREERNFGAQVRFILKQWIETQRSQVKAPAAE